MNPLENILLLLGEIKGELVELKKLHERVARRGIAQRMKEHHLKVDGQPAHDAGHQGRFANAPQAQHAHHPAVVLHHPLGERGQFPLAPKEARNIQRVPPIQEWPSLGWTLSWR